MVYVIGFFLFLAILGLLLIKFLPRHPATLSPEDSRYIVTDGQTAPEWFYHDTVLIPYFSGDYYIWPQFSLNRLLERKYTHMPDFWKINGKSVDYVLCHKRTHRKFIVHLDGTSHNEAKQRAKDEWLDDTCMRAKIPFYRQRQKRIYTQEDRAALAQAIRA